MLCVWGGQEMSSGVPVGACVADVAVQGLHVVPPVLQREVAHAVREEVDEVHHPAELARGGARVVAGRRAAVKDDPLYQSACAVAAGVGLRDGARAEVVDGEALRRGRVRGRVRGLPRDGRGGWERRHRAGRGGGWGLGGRWGGGGEGEDRPAGERAHPRPRHRRGTGQADGRRHGPTRASTSSPPLTGTLPAIGSRAA